MLFKDTGKIEAIQRKSEILVNYFGTNLPCVFCDFRNLNTLEPLSDEQPASCIIQVGHFSLNFWGKI